MERLNDPTAAQTLEIGVVLGQEFIPGQRMASITLGGVTLFSEIVYDTREKPAEENILSLFAARMRRLLEAE